MLARAREHVSWLVTPLGGNRHDFCDGVRGWASMCVLMFHLTVNTGLVAPETTWKYSVLLDGSFAVAVFFVVSGFSLSCIRGNLQIARAAAGRWPRLALPCMFHAFIGSLALHPADPVRLLVTLLYTSLLAFFPPSMGAWNKTPEWLHHVYGMAMHDGAFGQLWTMSFETSASYAIFAFSAITADLHVRRWACAAVLGLVLLLSPHYALFMAGVALQSMWAPNCSMNRVAAACAIATVIGAGFIPLHEWSTAWVVVAIIRVVVVFKSIEASPNAVAFFSCPPSIFLGRISFSLYISHVYITMLIARYVRDSWLASAVALPVCLAVATVTSCVDVAAMGASRLLAANIIDEDEDSSGA